MPVIIKHIRTDLPDRADSPQVNDGIQVIAGKSKPLPVIVTGGACQTIYQFFRNLGISSLRRMGKCDGGAYCLVQLEGLAEQTSLRLIPVEEQRMDGTGTL